MGGSMASNGFRSNFNPRPCPLASCAPAHHPRRRRLQLHRGRLCRRPRHTGRPIPFARLRNPAAVALCSQLQLSRRSSSLDAPYDPTSTAEQLTVHPTVMASINRIVAAAGQIAATGRCRSATRTWVPPPQLPARPRGRARRRRLVGRSLILLCASFGVQRTSSVCWRRTISCARPRR
jgi:hypothetical protein